MLSHALDRENQLKEAFLGLNQARSATEAEPHLTTMAKIGLTQSEKENLIREIKVVRSG